MELEVKDLDKHARILIVDDDERMLETLVEIFSNSGYKVTKASNGEEAIRRHRPALFRPPRWVHPHA